ncbi:hypothetical protein JTB14_017634 [Gonioctena quinquepunctata]|nr:hypothetical protein JTB14_017634 [Gonioctena quinquepunctata]
MVSNALRNDTSVDDIVSVSSCLTDVRTLEVELIALLTKEGFELRKWCSNEPSPLKDFHPSHSSHNPQSFENDSEATSLKLLGLLWSPIADCS